MDTTIINIGDELLIGQVVNSNAAVMGRMLTAAGFEVKTTLVVGDGREAIRSAVEQAMERSRVVLLTGGLGPTKDDITKQVLCDYFGSHLEESPVALENVSRIFAARGYELTPINRAQALVPACCEVLNNDLGTAPCMWFERDGRVLVSLPGVPFEMEWLMEHRVVPQLRKRFGQSERIELKNILVQGIGESFLSDLIEPWETSLPEGVKLAYLPEAGMIKLRLTAINRALEPELLRGLYVLAGQYIVGEDAENLAQLLHRKLTEMNLTLATAESCTGGTIASRMTAMAGASVYFRGGVVAYSNEVKQHALGVSEADLQQYGAVSETVALQMAYGARQRLGADIAIATTGIAGPDGGTPEKPVGTIWVAFSSAGKSHAECLHLGSTRRQQNVDRTVNHAIAMLIRYLCREE